MTKLALIGARPIPGNSGMMSVELGFESLCRRNGLDMGITRYCFGPPGEVQVYPDGTRVAFQDYVPNLAAVYEADVVLFWGDFLHARNYHDRDLRALIPEHFAGTEELFARYLLLSEAPESLLRRTLSFGTTLIGDDILLWGEQPIYRTALSRFVGNVAGIWTRDPMSAAQVAALRGQPTQLPWVTDCALLSRRADLLRIAGASPHEHRGLLVHFARTAGNHAPLLRFAAELAQAVGLSMRWLPWLNRSQEYRDAALQIAPALDWDSAPRDYAGLLRELLGARAVVTDTYHLALMAWRVGIPAVCVGVGAQRAVCTVSDKKKEVFYHAYNAASYYVYAEQLREESERPGCVAVAAAALNDGGACAGVVASIARHAEASERNLVEAINAVSGDRSALSRQVGTGGGMPTRPLLADDRLQCGA